MTKTLTEQWREGTLKSGNYYTVCYKGWSGETFPCNLYYSERIGFDANVKEVLAPVPSYDEYKRLQEQLDESKTENNNLLNDIVDLNLTIQHKEEQLKEAVDFIEELSEACDEEGILFPRQRKKLEEIKKWGVK